MVVSSDALDKRFLIKVSGEALAGNSGVGVDHSALDRIGREIAQLERSRRGLSNGYFAVQLNGLVIIMISSKWFDE